VSIFVTRSISGGSRICKRGAKVERRRREYRGAKGAEGVEFGEGYPPPQCGRGLGRRHGPLRRKFFDFESENGDF